MIGAMLASFVILFGFASVIALDYDHSSSLVFSEMKPYSERYANEMASRKLKKNIDPIIIDNNQSNTNNHIIKDIEAQKLEGIDSVRESVVDKNDNIYFIAGPYENQYICKLDGQGIITNYTINNEERIYEFLDTYNNKSDIFVVSTLMPNKTRYEFLVLKTEDARFSKIGEMNQIENLYIDRQSNVYIGTWQNGARVIVNGETELKKIDDFHMAQNLFAVDMYDNAYFVDRASPNDEVVFLANEEIYKPNPKIKKIIGMTNPNLGKYVNFLVTDKNDHLFVGTTQGLFKVNVTNLKFERIVSNAVDHGVVDRKNNFYFASYESHDFTAYVTTSTGSTKVIQPLKNLTYVIDHVGIDSDDNVYFMAIKNGLYILKDGESTATKIKGINAVAETLTGFISDKKGNMYIITFNYSTGNRLYYFLEKNNDTVEKIVNIDQEDHFRTVVVNNKNDAYIGTVNGVYLVKSKI